MPTYDLFPHPLFAAKAVRGVSVQLDQERGGTSLIYSIDAEVERLVLPPRAKPYRRDDLWKSTCLELFVGSRGGGYLELNFSPSREWAAYSFAAYRAEMAGLAIDADELLREPPMMWEEHGPGVIGYHLGVIVGSIAHGAAVALSAVVEETDGTKSYWALAHPPGPPDFHNPACFIATLPAPDAL